MGVRLVALPALSESDFDVAFTTFLTQQIGALLVANDTLFFSRRDELVALAARHAVPAMYSYPDYVPLEV
jgi:putative ABC transport system substrate-binding protein